MLTSYGTITILKDLFDQCSTMIVRPAPASDDDDVFDHYVSKAPSHQNAIDLLEGWLSAFPPELNLSAGAMQAYSDPRIQWAIAMSGGVAGKHVLELGPLEGSHSYMLDRAGATVDAIEANKGAFVRCLVAKEILKFSNVSFYLGDFVKWLRTTDRNYDLIVACGVLYHMINPLELLELMARHTNSVYLWTHFLDDAATEAGELQFDVEAFGSVQVRSRRRSYLSAERDPAFCGGLRDGHRWLHGDDILLVLRELGFSYIELNHVDPAHENGSAMSIFARKTG